MTAKKASAAIKAPESSAIEFVRSDAANLCINMATTDKLLRRTSLIAVGMTRCPPSSPDFFGGGPQTCAYLGFNRSSVLLMPDGFRPQVSSLNNVSFHNVGATYQRRAIDENGDHVDWFAIAPPFLQEVCSSALQHRERRSDSYFEQPFAPIANTTYLRQRLLFEKLAANDDIDDLAMEEIVIDIFRTIFRDASEFWGRNCSNRRPTSEKRRAVLVEEAKKLLVTEYFLSHTLSDLSAKLHCSPASLARAFQSSTGFRLHEYLNAFRLKKSLHLLRRSKGNIAGIAVALGFVSHSHYCWAFRKQFGMTPTDFANQGSQHAQDAARNLERTYCFV